MVNSKRKGKTGELEWVAFLKKHGIDARRGQQYKGTKDSPDVISSLNHIHFEVKRVEALNIYKAIKKAQKEANKAIPVVAHRKNREKWLVTMRGEDFIDMVKKV